MSAPDPNGGERCGRLDCPTIAAKVAYDAAYRDPVCKADVNAAFAALSLAQSKCLLDHEKVDWQAAYRASLRAPVVAVEGAVIQVRRRSDDYHAQIGDDAALWGCGKSANEAIGDVIRTHGDRARVTVALLGKGA